MSAIRDDANAAWHLTQQRLNAAEALRAAQAAAAEAARLAAERDANR